MPGEIDGDTSSSFSSDSVHPTSVGSYSAVPPQRFVSQQTGVNIFDPPTSFPTSDSDSFQTSSITALSNSTGPYESSLKFVSTASAGRIPMLDIGNHIAKVGVL